MDSRETEVPIREANAARLTPERLTASWTSAATAVRSPPQFCHGRVTGETGASGVIVRFRKARGIGLHLCLEHLGGQLLTRRAHFIPVRPAGRQVPVRAELPRYG